MKKFNLTFWGEVLPGKNPDEAMAGFAKLFNVEEQDRLARYFSGEKVVLRRNLESRAAADYYLKLNELGLQAELVEAKPRDAAETSSKREKRADLTALRQAAAQRKEAELEAKREAEAVRRKQTEVKAQQEAEAARRKRAELKAKQETEAAQRKQAELKAKQEAEAERRKQAELKAKREAEAAQRKRAELKAKQEADAAKRKQAEVKAQQEADAAQRKRVLNQAQQKAVSAKPQSGAFSAGKDSKKKRSKTTANLGQQRTEKKPATAAAIRPADIPNTYRLVAFRSTADIRERATRATQQSRQGLVAGCVALALLFIVLGRFISMSPEPLPQGPKAIATHSNGRLAMLVGNVLLLHNRAGVPEETLTAEELGLEALSPPLLYYNDDRLLVAGIELADEQQILRMWRCNLSERKCDPATGESVPPNPEAVVRQPLTGERIIALNEQLQRLNTSGEARQSVPLRLHARPVLRLDSGLLFINSAQGPAISVLRYDEQAFGQQLDEILLLPPAAVEKEQVQVGDFIRNGEYWWVNMSTADHGSTSLYLFDSQWRFIRELSRAAVAGPGRLVNWGERVLLFSPQQASVLRFNARGEPEVPLTSPAVADLIADRASQRGWVQGAWLASLLVLSLMTLLGFSWSYLQSTRALVYQGRPTHGAAPLDDVAERIEWLAAQKDRSRVLQQRSVFWSGITVAVLVVAVVAGLPALQLCAVLVIMLGPLLGLQFYARSVPEHTGLLNNQVVLVDFREVYHWAAGPRIQYRQPFVLIDDVVVFTGNRLLPGLDPEQVSNRLMPLVQTGIRVDRKTVAVKLLQTRHPLAMAIASIAITTTIATLLLAISFLPVQG